MGLAVEAGKKSEQINPYPMTIREQDKIVSDLIREKPDATIKDFLEILEEVNAIEKATD